MMHAAPGTLDPADSSTPDSFARRNLTFLLFDTLVTRNDAGVTPGLAESWQSTRGNQRWQFRLRHGVKFHDGAPLTSEVVAASLRVANPAWSVRPEGDSVTVDCDQANPEMLAELALQRNAIVKRDGEQVSGTGPFHIVDWQPAKKLTLAAEDNCWRGRPFLDGIEIEMGRGFRDQTTALEVGRADVVEVAPEQSQHFSQAKGRLVNSAPLELMALIFAREFSSSDEKLRREALGLSLERASMHNVLLQGAGQPAGSLLPTWISGFGFVFPSQADLQKARQLRSQVQPSRAWTVGYDASDPLARLLAERIALNAKDAGLSLVPTGVGATDLRLMRIPITSSNSWIALEGIAIQTGLSKIKMNGGSVEDLYTAEQAALASERVIPLFHLPVFYAASTNLRSWAVRSDGSLDLANAWLGPAK
jgi:ABC-type transport system substrate-binding protein